MVQKTLFKDKNIETKDKHYGSVFEDEQELLKAIIEIHCPEGIELDPMFFKGNFYKKIQKPKYVFDINPQTENIRKGDARNLELPSNSIGSMILDPPFMIATRKSQREYYSSGTHGYYTSLSELEKNYNAYLKEAERVLKSKGTLIFKCQDYTDSKTLMIHCMVYQWAINNNFYAKDLAILNNPKNKKSNSALTQRHFRKIHTYFWIFIKRKEE